MKFSYLCLFTLCLISNLFAQQNCGEHAIPKILSDYTNSADVMNCIATKNKHECSKLESELGAEEKYKIIQCTKESLEANSLGKTSLTDCVWNGLKISGEALLDITKLPGKIGEVISKGFKETQICNTSVEKKREILNAFNLTVEDDRYKLTEQFLGKYLEEATCSELEKLVSSRYQNYQNNLYRDRISAINSGKKVEALKTNKNGPTFNQQLEEAFKQAGAAYSCYTPKVKAEMICAGVTSLLTDAALGGGILLAAKKISTVVKSKRALSNIGAAINDGRPISLSDSSQLMAGDRLRASQELLGIKRPLMDSEKRAILEAHEIGISEGRGYFTYTEDDIIKKVKKLRREGNFSEAETRKLMEAGLTGIDHTKDSFFRNAVKNHFNKFMAINLTLAQENALLLIHNIPLGSGFSEAASKVLKEASFSDDQIKRILQIKSNNEKKITEVVSNTFVQEKKTALTSTPVAKPAAVSPTTSPTISSPPPVKTVVDVEPQGRKIVLNMYKDDLLYQYKPLDIPEGTTGERLAEKMRAQQKHAQEALAKLEKKNPGFGVQETIIEDGQAIKRARANIDKYEMEISKLPAKGADFKRKELEDQLVRSKTSLEVYEKRCKQVLDLYKAAYNVSQYVQQYERDWVNYCK
jgi:hypothetical protein